MRPRSAKAKGKRFQNQITKLFHKAFGGLLEEGDIKSTTMGEHGVDIQLSPAAKKLIPYAVECKCQEKLNIWSALEQAENNANGSIPVVFFKRNRSKSYAVVEAEHFIDLISPENEE